MKKILLIIFTFLTGITYSQQLTKQQIENLYSFSKLYGYIRYFHPSDEADKINWSNFAVYGAEKVENCKNKEELKEELLKLFKPLAPSLKIIYKNENYIYDIKEITPSNPEEYEIYYWRHKGLGQKEDIEKSNTHTSWRNKTDYLKRHKIKQETAKEYGIDFFERVNKCFSKELEIGDLVKKDIGSNLICLVPLVIYGNENGTYPMSKISEYKSLKDSVYTRFDLIERGKNKYNRLAGIIIIWNTIQHFYPYLEDLQIDWEKELVKYLTRTYSDQNDNDYIKTLKLFTGQLKDGHMSWGNPYGRLKKLQIEIDYAEDKFFVSKVLDSLSLFEKGDIIEKIDGVPINEYYENKSKYVQAASETAKRIKTLFEMNHSYELDKSEVQLQKYKNKKNTVNYINYNPSYIKEKNEVVTIADTIKIIQNSSKELENILKDTLNTKHIIIDLRNIDENAFDLLLTFQDTTKWLGVLSVLKPDREGLREFCWDGWTELVPTQSPSKIKKYFLIDGSIQSLGESIVALLQHYKVGKFIGERTAGINGNVNRLELPGGFSTTWTGLYVRKPDGTKHFCEGIVPDIEVKRTIKGIVEGRDEILERAIEYIKNGK